MQKIFISFSALAMLFALYESNPKRQHLFVEHMTQQAQAECCLKAASSTASSCKWLRPMTRPFLYGVFSFYADKPQNYFLFTKYAIQLPTHTVHGVGVAGHFLDWNESFGEENSCSILHSLLPTRFRQ